MDFKKGKFTKKKNNKIFQKPFRFRFGTLLLAINTKGHEGLFEGAAFCNAKICLSKYIRTINLICFQNVRSWHLKLRRAQQHEMSLRLDALTAEEAFGNIAEWK